MDGIAADRILDHDDAEEPAIIMQDVPTTSAPNVLSIPHRRTELLKEKGGPVISSFKDMALSPELLRSVLEAGLTIPSEVQHECIPKAILGSDIVCQAKSGMGKTAVFVIAILQRIQPVEGQVSALVICHTRELAFQIFQEFERFSKYIANLRIGYFIGGYERSRDEEILQDSTTLPHIVVGTPGRLKELVLLTNRMKLNKLKFLVLDECDKMLCGDNMRTDVIRLFQEIPRQKQVMMFSATLPEKIRSVCKKFMNNPVEIYIDDDAKLCLNNLQQYFMCMKENEKEKRLGMLLEAEDFNQVVVFVRTVERCKALKEVLEVEHEYPVIHIHGQMPQEERIKRYDMFKNYHRRILVATDLFVEIYMGKTPFTHFSHVNLVINYDMSDDSDTYIHRIARAGRYGTEGKAISFVSAKWDAKVLNEVQNRINLAIEKYPDEKNSCA